MKLFDRLLDRLSGRRTRAGADTAATEQSGRERAAAREYWDAQVAADLKRRGISKNGRPD